MGPVALRVRAEVGVRSKQPQRRWGVWSRRAMAAAWAIACAAGCTETVTVAPVPAPDAGGRTVVLDLGIAPRDADPGHDADPGPDAAIDAAGDAGGDAGFDPSIDGGQNG